MADFGGLIPARKPLDLLGLAETMGAIPAEVPIPGRKPFGQLPTQEQLAPFMQENVISSFDPQVFADEQRQLILELQSMLSDTPFELMTRPLSRFGSQGITERIVGVPGVQSRGNAIIGGSYFPGGTRGPVKDLIELFGEEERLAEDVTAISFPRFLPGEFESTFIHEAAHRGLERLRKERGKTNQELFGRRLGLNEEDVVRLLDYATNTEIEGVIAHFLRNKDVHPDELLADPEVLELLMDVQEAAAEALNEQGIETPIHFPTNEQ